MKSLFVATLVAIAVGTTTTAEAGLIKKPEVVRAHRNGHHFDHTTLELPDLNSAKGTMTMSCTTCSELTEDIWDTLHPKILLQKGSDRVITKSTYATVIDNACLHLDNKYGLELDGNGKASHTMSNDSPAPSANGRLRGQWVNKYVTKECARIIRTTHERILHGIHEFKNVTDFTQKVCVEWSNSCPLIKQQPTHEAMKYRSVDL